MKATLKMLALPIIGFALASAGAVSTSTAKTSKTAMPPMTGYIHTASGGCQAVQVNCKLEVDQTCLYLGQAVWSRPTPNGPCAIPLFRDQ